MKTFKLQIPSMVSHHCQMTVQNTVSKIEGAIVKGVQPAQLQIGLENSPLASVIEAIEKAGYRVADFQLLN